MDKKLLILGIVLSVISVPLVIFSSSGDFVTPPVLVDSSGKIVNLNPPFRDIQVSFTGIVFLLIVLYFILSIIYNIIRFIMLTIQKNKEKAELRIRKSLFSLIYAVILIFLWIIVGIIPRLLGIQLL